MQLELEEPAKHPPGCPVLPKGVGASFPQQHRRVRKLGEEHHLLARLSPAPNWPFSLATFQYVGTQFVQAAHPILEEAWTPEVEKAWEVRGGQRVFVACFHPTNEPWGQWRGQPELCSPLNHSLPPFCIVSTQSVCFIVRLAGVLLCLFLPPPQSLFNYLAITMTRGFCEEEKAMGASQAADSSKPGAESTPNQV